MINLIGEFKKEDKEIYEPIIEQILSPKKYAQFKKAYKDGAAVIDIKVPMREYFTILKIIMRGHGYYEYPLNDDICKISSKRVEVDESTGKIIDSETE